MSSSWPEYQKDLETFAAAGMSAAVIAEKLGVTKNAVIGRARTTGVKLKGKSGRNKQRVCKDG